MKLCKKKTSERQIEFHCFLVITAQNMKIPLIHFKTILLLTVFKIFPRFFGCIKKLRILRGIIISLSRNWQYISTKQQSENQILLFILFFHHCFIGYGIILPSFSFIWVYLLGCYGELLIHFFLYFWMKH